MEVDGAAPPSGFFAAAPPTTPNAVQTPLVFGLIVPGHAVRTDFTMIEQYKYALTLDSASWNVPVASIRELVLFLATPTTTPLPVDYGVLCYWQMTTTNNQQSSGFELLGALTAQQPSAVFSTGWSEHDQVAQLGTQTDVTITIGLSIEPMASVQNIGAVSNHDDRRLFVAQKVASDLFKFMQSFDTGSNNSNMMVVPNNVFDRWFRRFEARFQRDPNFFLKQRNDDS